MRIKILLSLLILTVSLNADEISLQNKLNNIIKNGWSDNNRTLNQKIISHYKNNREEILKRIQKPLKITLSVRSDVLLLESYTKYLEHQGKFDESLKINIQILESINNVKNNSAISLLGHMIFESMVRNSLFELIKDNKNFKISKKQYNEIRNNLILDKTLLMNAAKEEKKDFEKIFKNFCEGVIDTAKDTKKAIEYVSIIAKEIKDKEDLRYKKIFHAIEIGTPKSIENLNKEFKKFNNIERSKLLAKTNYSAKDIATTLIIQTTHYVLYTSTNYFETIKNNNLLLEKLKKRVKN